jgi:hypothetical protein
VILGLPSHLAESRTTLKFGGWLPLTLTFYSSNWRLRTILAASAVYQLLVLITRTYPKPAEDIAFA